MKNKDVDIVFCVVPWLMWDRPSLAMGLLKGICEQESVSSEVMYLNLDLAGEIGTKKYASFAANQLMMAASEHLFAANLFGVEATRSDAYIEKYEVAWQVHAWRKHWTEITAQGVRELRDVAIPKMLEKWVDRIEASNAKVVALSAVFNQTLPALTLAKWIRDRLPDVTIIMGGSRFHSPMGEEFHRVFPEIIDYAFLGDADESFRTFLRRLKAGEPLTGIMGTSCYVDNELCISPPEPFYELNSNPTPVYDDFFEEIERVRDETGKRFGSRFIPYESGRGCWWGEHKVCTFCGLDGNDFKVRVRDNALVLQDMQTMSARYDTTNFFAVDLAFVWTKQRALLEMMRDDPVDYSVYYEVRVGMSKKQVKMLSEAGVHMVQPGIESLSTGLLKHMDKGTTAIKNVEFLRWAMEYDIDCDWTLLANFPKEDVSWYQQAVDLIPQITHLQPPVSGISIVQIHRYSPLYKEALAEGVELTPCFEYEHCYPEGFVDLMKVTYAYDFEDHIAAFDDEVYQIKKETVDEQQEEPNLENRTRGRGALPPEKKVPSGYIRIGKFKPLCPPVKAMGQATQLWTNAYKSDSPPSCSYRLGAGFVKVDDTRFDKRKVYVFRNEVAAILLLCDRVTAKKQIFKRLGPHYSQEELDGAIAALIERKLLYEEDGRLLTLPISEIRHDTALLESFAMALSHPARSAAAK